MFVGVDVDLQECLLTYVRSYVMTYVICYQGHLTYVNICIEQYSDSFGYVIKRERFG